MKPLITLFLLAIACPLSAQEYTKIVSELQSKYKESPVAVLAADISYEFTKDVSKKLVKVLENKTQKLLSLRYNQMIHEYLSYDNNSAVERFYATSNLRQEAPDKTRYCGTYTTEGYFYDDSKFCSQTLKLKELGELWTVNSIKRVNDSKYQTSVYFQSEYPVVNKTVSFIIPEDIEVELKEFNFEGYSINKSENISGSKKTITYTVSSLAPFQNVKFKPGVQHYSPHILILVKSMKVNGKTMNLLSSLDDLYSWYRSLTTQLQPSTVAIKPLVDELIKGKTTDEEKIKSIFYWVQDNIRYIAYEDGIAGFKPDEAQNVFEKKYGDCKGMANLTKEMLKLAGFDARLTWIGTKAIRYDYTLPSLAVDNHMICTVILGDKKYFLDATEDYNPLGEYAERIQNRPVLIEDGEKYILDKVPAADKTKDLEKYNYTAKINGEIFEGSGKVTLHGETKKDFLYLYNHTQNDKKKDYLSSFINDGKTSYQVSGINMGDMNERSGPFDIEFNFSIANSISKFNNEMYIDIDPSKDFKNGSVLADRQSDIDFGEKIFKKTSIELVIPADYKVAELPENLSIAEKDFSFSISYKQEGDKIIYSKEISVDKGIISKSEFEKWNAGIKKLTKAYESQITLKKQ
jgi:transglutaminase-like putative cysteine protease